jgi:HPt (histidine-containing phosphotransfer) domain-containing protein
MDAYVTKPVRIDELNKTLAPLMTREPEPVPASGPTVTAEPSVAQETAPVVLTEALEVVGGDVDILREAVALSLAEVPEQMAELKAAMLRQDAKRVEATAHRLKGVMANLGGLAAREAGQQLETMGEQSNLSEGTAGVTAFEKEAARVVAFYSNPAWEQLARQCQEAMDV